jgi:hypothetical protein
MPSALSPPVTADCVGRGSCNSATAVPRSGSAVATIAGAGSGGDSGLWGASVLAAGELFGQPRITFQSRDASDVERASYQTAVAETLKRCASLPFTEAFGNGIAGEPLTMRFVDDRKRPPD